MRDTFDEEVMVYGYSMISSTKQKTEQAGYRVLWSYPFLAQKYPDQREQFLKELKQHFPL